MCIRDSSSRHGTRPHANAGEHPRDAVDDLDLRLEVGVDAALLGVVAEVLEEVLRLHPLIGGNCMQ
eukprot:6807258-Alexandrium_andersonii.AAC.1